MYNKNRLSSEKGSIVLGALGIAVLVGIFGGVIATQMKSTNELSQLPRIRATMAQIELQTRLAAYSAPSYACDYGPLKDSYQCVIRQNVFDNIRANVDDGVVRVQNVVFGADQRFQAQIVFVRTGTNSKMSIAPRVLDVPVPAEILQPATFTCPTNRPMFAGYFPSAGPGHKQGEADCRAIPQTDCGVGRYVASIDPLTLEPRCEDAGRAMSCSANEFYSTFEWNGGSTVNGTCAPRKDPFTEMGFDYASNSTLDPTYISRDPDSADPQPPPLPAPEVVTWSNPNPQPASTCYVPPPVNCQGSFGACSVPCAGGLQTFLITQPAANGGAACAYTNGATQACNTQACPVTPPPPPSSCGWRRIADNDRGLRFQNFAVNSRHPFLAFIAAVSQRMIPEAGACTVLGEETACNVGDLTPEGLCFSRQFGGQPPGPVGSIGTVYSFANCTSSNNGQQVRGIWGNTCTGGNPNDGSMWQCECAATPPPPPPPSGPGTCTCVNSELMEFPGCGGNVINPNVTHTVAAADAAACAARSNRCDGTASKLMVGQCSFTTTPNPPAAACSGNYLNPNNGDSTFVCPSCSDIATEEVTDVNTCDIQPCGPRPVLPTVGALFTQLRSQISASGRNPDNFTFDSAQRGGNCPAPGCDAWFPMTYTTVFACPK